MVKNGVGGMAHGARVVGGITPGGWNYPAKLKFGNMSIAHYGKTQIVSMYHQKLRIKVGFNMTLDLT